MSLLRKQINKILSEIPFLVLFSFLTSFSIPYYLWYKFDDANILNYLFSSSGMFARYSLGIFYTCLLIISLGKYLSRFKYLLYSFAVFYFAIVFFLQKVFAMELTPIVYNMVLETNKNEASGFIKTFLLSSGAIKTYLFVILLISLIYISEKFRLKIYILLKGKCNTFLTILILGCSLNSVRCFTAHFKMLECHSMHDINEWERFFGPLSVYNVFDSTIFSLYYEFILKSQVNKCIQISNNLTNVEKSSQDLNLVFVLGESFIKSHSPLYGYHRNTNPYLVNEQKKGNLYVFNNVISPYNNTMETERNVFSCNSMLDAESWSDFPLFQSVFYKAGFNVYAWDILRRPEKSDLGDFSTNSLLYSERLAKIYKKLNIKSFLYDADLIDDFFKERINLDTSNLIIFHLMGQHIPYSERYPHSKDFSKFTNKNLPLSRNVSVSAKNIINDYDNATLYNDYVIYKIISKFYDTNTVIVYMSDHGEEVFDYRDSQGRTINPPSGFEKEWLKYEFDIPFMIWCSDKYIKNNSKIVNQIVNSQNKPFMSDITFQILFHLSGVKTSYYMKMNDVLEDSFIIRDRIIGNGMNYDKIIFHNP